MSNDSVMGSAAVATPIERTTEGSYPFWFAAQKFISKEPSMMVADILKMVNGSTHGNFFEDRDGKSVFFSHGEAVDLTHSPHFSVLLPATMCRGNP